MRARECGDRSAVRSRTGSSTRYCGARGEGKFQRVTGEQALDFFATRLKDLQQKYGPESVALLPHGVASSFFSTLMKAFGTPNSAEPAFAQCRGPREVGYALTFEQGLGSP